MACTAEKVIQIALDEVGYLEKKSNSQLDDKIANAGANNYTKYARDLDKISGFYNGKKNGYPWCDVFADWCFVTAFGVDKAREMLNQPSKSLGAGCGYSAKYYKNKGRFYTKNPKIGDQIFFWNSNKTEVAHTGLVYNVDSTYVYTVEGNTSASSGVVDNGGAVEKKKYKLSYNRIYGYGRPDYDISQYEKWTGYVNTKNYNLNVRSSANSKNNSNIIGSLAKGTSVEITGEDGNWYEIVYDNRTAYVSKDYICKEKLPTTHAFEAYNVRVIAKSGLNIRKGAGTSFSKIGALSYGSIVKVSKVSNGWGYIANKNGWISLEYCKKI